jgi:hypothetical protein
MLATLFHEAGGFEASTIEYQLSLLNEMVAGVEDKF